MRNRYVYLVWDTVNNNLLCVCSKEVLAQDAVKYWCSMWDVNKDELLIEEQQVDPEGFGWQED